MKIVDLAIALMQNQSLSFCNSNPILHLSSYEVRCSFLYLFYLRQYVLKDGVIMFDAVVKVDFHHFVRPTVDFFFIGMVFICMVLQFLALLFEFYLFGGSGIGQLLVQCFQCRAVAGLLFMYVVSTHSIFLYCCLIHVTSRLF